MGNSFPSNGNIKFGSNLIMNFNRREEKSSGHRECWQVKYIIESSFVNLLLNREFDRDGRVQGLRLQFFDRRYRSELIIFFIDKAENDLLNKIDFESIRQVSDTNTMIQTEKHDSRGFVTKTSIFFHGGGRGLIVVEENSTHIDMNPYKVTVKHYYAVPREDYRSRNKIDIGLSMVVDISVSNNVLVLSVVGPVHHPSSTLLRMIKEVARTGIWKGFETTHEHDSDTGSVNNRVAVVNNNQNVFWGDNNASVNTHYHFHEYKIIDGNTNHYREYKIINGNTSNKVL
ncbi:hypothetical protein MtrunA17_Chr6g0486181 [Medicago truncatula]|uniref:Uncharacterized protein n=1 Tax=Medicago truncatula TaxID=3880 RepID=G8A0M6_MEDTR|nr:hypothetical protein MTR_6g488260 [Medicago truncatula]RHN52952.1 hypothetical protein MtrunA17_Chr6g0486181 [Medicago truncatula]